MDYVLSLLGPLAQGAVVTLKLFFITLALAVPLGLALALARVSRFAPLSGAVNGYIWLMRGTPLMLQMLFIYFALPFVPVIGVRLPDFPAAIVAFALNYAAYFAEIFRAGIQSIAPMARAPSSASNSTSVRASRSMSLPASRSAFSPTKAAVPAGRVRVSAAVKRPLAASVPRSSSTRSAASPMRLSV